jgi:hypothetical protein
MAEQRENLKATTAMLRSQLAPPFRETFSFLDAFWFLLATAIAFKLGYGNNAILDKTRR